MRHLPLLLTHLRLALVPVALALGATGRGGWPVVLCLVVAFLSDVFDGILARRLGVDTPGMRVYDSVVDLLFYLAILFAAWKLHSDVVAGHAAWIGAVVGLEVVRYVFDFAKFRKSASYHAWSAKAFGLLLFLACVVLFATGKSYALTAALAVGVLSELEGLAMSILLPTWEHDVRHLGLAWKRRRHL